MRPGDPDGPPASGQRPSQRTIVVWIPDWPVLAAATGEGLSPDLPLAVLHQGRVLATSAAARAEGVRRGLRARDAQSRCPELRTLGYDPVVDARAFDPVISCLETLTPGIQPIRPGMCALRARGPTRFFGSESAAADKLLDRLETYDVPGGRVGVADGPFAAEQAARTAPPATRVRVVEPGRSAAFLAPLTIDTLERPELTDLLRRLGLRSLGAFARLPKAEVLTRFGPDGALAHRLARGADDRVVVGRQLPPDLARALDFEPPVDRVDQVAFAVRTVADELIGRLSTLGLVCTTLRVEVATESGRVHEREWLHPRWFGAADVVDRVRWQLQGSGTATSELTSPVVRLRLVPERADPVGAHAEALWGGGPDERIHRALSRVQSMLGHGAVLTPVISGGRGYAERQTLIPWGDPATPTRSPTDPWPGSLTTPAPTSPLAPPPPESRGHPAGVPPVGGLVPASETPAPSRWSTWSRASQSPDTVIESLATDRPAPPQSAANLPDQAQDTPSQIRDTLSWTQDVSGQPQDVPDQAQDAPAQDVPSQTQDVPGRGQGMPAQDVPGRVQGAPSRSAPAAGRLPEPPGRRGGSLAAPAGGSGAWPVLVPTTICPEPRLIQVLTAERKPVVVFARGDLSGPPAVFRFLPAPQVADSTKLFPVVAWAGPWQVDERWWDEEAGNRLARFQFVTADGRAWLAVVQQTRWRIEATYD